jgi:hypothetical protein
LSSLTQIIVIKFLGAFQVVYDTLNFLEERMKISSEQVQASMKQNQVSVKFKRAIKVSEL